MNEHSGLDRDVSQLGHAVTFRIGCRGMDDKLGCTVRVPQREKRK